MRVVCLLLEKKDDAQTIAEIFYRATPQIRLKGNEAVFLEISKCQSLYSEDGFLKRTLVTLKKIGVRAKMAVAHDIPTALSLATFSVRGKDDLPIEALRYYCDPLGLHPEQLISILKTIGILKSLRIQKLKDFLNIPSYQIAPRFGGLVLMAYQRAACGEHPIEWPEFQPRKNVEESFEFDLASPPRGLEPIYFVLRPLIEKMVLRLRAKGKRARQFKLVLQQEYATQKTPQNYEVTIIIQLPFVTTKTLLQITKEKLESSIHRRPLEHAVMSLSVIVTEEAPYVTSQKDIFDQKKEENSESFFQLVSRIATKLGPNAAFFAELKENYLPERNWSRASEKVLNTVQETVTPERPLRLFKEPRPVQVIDNKLFYNRQHYVIIEWKNAEVLLSNWWDLGGGERIYHKLNTSLGDSFWIFTNRDHYYLHGIFE